MMNVRPVLVALPLDHETSDIVAVATELARRLEAPLVVVHALALRRETALARDERIAQARSQLEVHLAPLRDSGVEIQDVLLPLGDPAEVVVASGLRLAAQMILTGGGRPATIRRWLVGSVAEAVVRRSSVPVWVARGAVPSGRTLLCPVDFSPAARVGLEAAIRMARLFALPLSLITVIEDTFAPEDRDAAEAGARARLESWTAGADLGGLDVSLSVAAGDPAEKIVDAAKQAGLMVSASRGYDPLVREWLGPVTTRSLRHSHCSTLTIRHLAEGHDERLQAITRLAEAFEHAKELIGEGLGDDAVTVLELLAEQAPTNAAIQEAYAIALESVDRDVEATSRHGLAALIRERLTRVP